MDWKYTPYVLPLVVTAAVLATIALVAWRRRHVPGATPLLFLMLALVEWTLGNVLEIGSTNLSTKLLWGNVEYSGIVTLPVAWLALALHYVGREKWLTRRNLALLAIVPSITLVLVWTNDLHGLMRLNIGLDTTGPFPSIAETHGLWFWVHTAYSYTLTLLGTLVLARAFFLPPGLYRGQAGVLLVGALIPWVANALYISGHELIQGLDTTPCAFALSGLVMAWGVFRFHLLDIVPMARDAVIEGMSDGVIVLNVRNRIVDLNPAAGRITGRTAAEAIGRPAAQVISGRPDLIEPYLEMAAARAEVILGEHETERSYDLYLSPLRDRRGRLTGRLVVLRDVTEQKRAEAALRESKEKIESLHDVARRLGACETEEEVYQLTIDAAEKILNFSMCYLGVMEGNELVTKVASSEALPRTGADRHLYESLAAKACTSRESQIFLDTNECIQPGQAQGYFRSGVAVPIADIGVVELLSTKPNAFTCDDVRMLELLVGHAAEAVRRIQLQEELKEQAIRDPLTGLYNRRYFSQMIDKEVERSRRYSHSITFLMIDVNSFKEINDRFGHQAGDRVLQEIGSLLQKQVRQSDVVVRYGGDEFLIILPETQVRTEAVAQRLRAAIARWNEKNRIVNFPVTLAIGTSCWDPAGTESVEAALHRADQRMYEDKGRQAVKGRHVPPFLRVQSR
ncbi:MAG: histidine kinase N-terminal 7TM domain-containing protein [Bacillota bacterium]